MSPESTAPSGQALPAGTRLEEFEVERVLGSGGFGITYLARDVKLGRQVVIKENLPAQFAFRDMSSLTVSPRNTEGEDAENFAWSLENFSREASILASLDHPGIVPVMRKFEANGTAYFVMPHVGGVALDAMQKRRREKGQSFADDELRGLLEHVLDALGYLHSRGIYHRDIKPGNILVTKKGVPILIDFGSARQRLSERSMTVVESAGYTPFEQLQSRGNVGPWSDLDALGATVAKAIRGEAPPKAMDRMRKDPYEPLYLDLELRDRYSKALLDSIDRALQVDEASRWQDAGQWQRGLVALEERGQFTERVWETGRKVVAPPPLAQSPNEEFQRVKEGDEDAVEKCRKMAEEGCANAQFNLGCAYASGRGVVNDDVEAVNWFRRAAEQGNPVAQTKIGTSFENGIRVVKDAGEAVKWYRRAAEQGNFVAQFNLAVAYEQGRGTGKDEVEAVKWYHRAAEQGYPDAQYKLGALYEFGQGVRKDKDEAVKWYRKALATGVTDAGLALRRLGATRR